MSHASFSQFHGGENVVTEQSGKFCHHAAADFVKIMAALVARCMTTRRLMIRPVDCCAPYFRRGDAMKMTGARSHSSPPAYCGPLLEGL